MQLWRWLKEVKGEAPQRADWCHESKTMQHAGDVTKRQTKAGPFARLVYYLDEQAQAEGMHGCRSALRN